MCAPYLGNFLISKLLLEIPPKSNFFRVEKVLVRNSFCKIKNHAACKTDVIILLICDYIFVIRKSVHQETVRDA